MKINVDPFRQEVEIYLGQVCPVKAIVANLTIRGDRAGPFLQYYDGTPPSGEWLVTQACQALLATGKDTHYQAVIALELELH